MDLPRNTIFVSEDEELVSVLERIHASSFKELFIVVPGGAIIGRSALNLKILKKEAEQHDKTLRIAAQDPGFHRLAQGLGIAWEGDVSRFWKTIEQKAGDPRLRYAKDYVAMSDIVAVPEGDEIDDVVLEDTGEEEVSEVVEELAPQVVILEQEEEEALPQPFAAAKETVRKKSEDVGETISRLYHRMDASMQKEKSKKKKGGRRKKVMTGSGDQQSWLILTGFGVVAVGLFILVASVVLPRADVVITPRSEKASVELAVIADANRSGVDLEQSAIPGQVLEVRHTIRRTFASTGEENVNEHAGGTITVYNEFSSEPQTLVKTTRFLSESGDLFRTVETVIIPGARIDGGQIIPSSIQVAIQADKPGPDYNIGASRFTIPGFEGTPKFEAFYGKSDEAMNGGAIGKVRVATNDDIEGATAIVEQEARTAAELELRNKIPDDLTLLSEAQEVEVVQSQRSTEVGDAVDEFEIVVEVRARAFVFRDSDIGALVTERLLGSIIEGSKEVRPDSLALVVAQEVLNFDEGTLTMTINAEQSIAWIVDAEVLRQELSGKNEQGVQEVLVNHLEVAEVEVTFWPFWVNEVPDNVDRIDIEIR